MSIEPVDLVAENYSSVAVEEVAAMLAELMSVVVMKDDSVVEYLVAETLSVETANAVVELASEGVVEVVVHAVVSGSFAAVQWTVAVSADSAVVM